MRFDDAGREEVLLSLKLAIKERDHDFFLPDICEEAEGDLAEEWKPRDFVNIICHPDDNAPLRVEDGVEIIGGNYRVDGLGGTVAVFYWQFNDWLKVGGRLGPPPGPGRAGVNGAEESAPPGSEKPTGLFSLIRDAWGAGSLVEVVGEEPQLRRQQKRMPRWDGWWVEWCLPGAGQTRTRVRPPAPAEPG